LARQNAADLNKIRRANRINRLAKASHHLIETAAEFWTKALGERRA
jgi:hypothetical protein